MREWSDGIVTRGGLRPVWLDGHSTERGITDTLDELSSNTVLVIDDAHQIASAALNQFIGDIRASTKPITQLVVAGRLDPGLPLARHRSTGMVVDLNESLLRIDVRDIEQFAVSRNIELTAPETRQIANLTEGWALAVSNLLDEIGKRTSHSGLSIDDAADRASDVLVALAMNTLPEPIAGFLTESSMLATLTAESYEFVTGSTDLWSSIVEAQRAGIFVSPLDRNNTSFRIHGMLRRGLYRRLKANVRTATLVELELRASQWAFDSADHRAAIQHALAAGRPEAAADFLAHDWGVNGSTLMPDGMQLFDGFDLSEYVPFVLTRGFLLADLGDADGTHDVLTHLRQMRWDGPLPHGHATLESALLDLAGCAPNPDAQSPVGEMQRVINRDEVGADGPRELLQRFMLAFTLYCDGDVSKADHAANEIMRGHLAVGRDSVADQTATVLGANLLALISNDRGDTITAQRHIQQALHLLDLYGFDDLHFRAAQVHDLAVAVISPDSEEKAQALRRLVVEAPNTGPKFHALIELCRLLDRAGDTDGALAVLDEAQTLATNASPEPLYAERLRRLRLAVDASVTPEPIVAAVTPGERAVLRLLPTERTQTDISELLGLSVNTVKSHLRSIYQKFGVSSRVEAVDYAIQLGLLCTVVPWNPPKSARPD